MILHLIIWEQLRVDYTGTAWEPSIYITGFLKYFILISSGKQDRTVGSIIWTDGGGHRFEYCSGNFWPTHLSTHMGIPEVKLYPPNPPRVDLDLGTQWSYSCWDWHGIEPLPNSPGFNLMTIWPIGDIYIKLLFSAVFLLWLWFIVFFKI